MEKYCYVDYRENIAMLISEQRRNPQLSYKSDIIFVSGKQIPTMLDPRKQHFDTRA